MKALLTSLLIPAILSASDWTQFRGPDVSGVAEKASPPVTFDGATSIAWKAPLPGRGLSSPLIIGDRIYLTAASGPKQEQLHVLCFNAADGKLVWDREFRATGRTMCHDKTCNAAPTPCSDGKFLYALYSSNDLLCLDLEGNLQWLRGLMVDYPNASNSLGLASSPVIADGVLVDATELAKDAGFRYPLAFTRAAWETCVSIPVANSWQDETGRLWDVLVVLGAAIRSGVSGSVVQFAVHVRD